jgi:hypothetical protein
VSETGAELLDDHVDHPTEDQKHLERLEVMVAANTKKLSSLYKVVTWVFILVIVVLALIWRPRF